MDEGVRLGWQKKKVEAEIENLKKQKDVALQMGDVRVKPKAIL
jgi:hypothetical protein